MLQRSLVRNRIRSRRLPSLRWELAVPPTLGGEGVRTGDHDTSDVIYGFRFISLWCCGPIYYDVTMKKFYAL